jgi:hypothetical protein
VSLAEQMLMWAGINFVAGLIMHKVIGYEGRFCFNYYVGMAFLLMAGVFGGLDK